MFFWRQNAKLRLSKRTSSASGGEKFKAIRVESGGAKDANAKEDSTTEKSLITSIKSTDSSPGVADKNNNDPWINDLTSQQQIQKVVTTPSQDDLPTPQPTHQQTQTTENDETIADDVETSTPSDNNV